MSEVVTRPSVSAVPAAASRRPGFLRRHWRGDYSLARSYWLHTVLLTSLTPALAIPLLARLTNDMPARYGMGGVLFIAAFSYLAWTWNPWGCSQGNVLINDYSGTPTATFGEGFKAHLLTQNP